MSLNYTFEQLNPREFEELVTDLLKKKLDTSVERFKGGKDLGVDSRLFDSSNGEGIIQCKHYIKSGVNKLISDLEKKELPKIKVLQPTRYIIATTCPLSRINKQEIKRKLSPYVLSDIDIFGQEDLNDLLKEYPEIEQAHYKLWLTSTNVLHSLLNNALLGRSQEYLKNIILKQSKFLVQTEHYPKALQMIQERNTIIITGSPGVGKTTLASQISLHLCLNEEYEFYCIDENITEAEEIFQEGKKQLFYFDDFLGSNILEALNTNNRDSKVLRFIERVKNNSNKRFILTSRAHILNQKISLNERYNHAKIDKDRYELEIAELSDLDKAKILYNHIWHSNLPEEYIDEIYLEKRYKKIIKHRNYNPRIIEFITDFDRMNSIDSKKYWAYIQNTLDNPEEIWKQVIDTDIDEISRYILLAITLNGNHLAEDELQNFYDLLLKKYIDIDSKKRLRNIVEPLINSLIIVIMTRFGKVYRLLNPSIADYMISAYINESKKLNRVNSILYSESHALYIDALSDNGIIHEHVYKELANNKAIQILEKKNHDLTYIDIVYLNICWDYFDVKIKERIDFRQVSKFLIQEIQSPDIRDHDHLIHMLNLLYKHMMDGNINVYLIPNDIKKILEKLLLTTSNDGLYIYEYFSYHEFLEIYEMLYQSDDIGYSDLFKDTFLEFILGNGIINDLLIQYNRFPNLLNKEDYDPNITKKLIDLVFIEDLDMSLTKEEINELVNSASAETIIDHNNRNCSITKTVTTNSNHDKLINHLFNRS